MSRKTRTPATLADQLRAAIDESEHSRYRLCKLTDISQSTLSRFMAGTCSLSLDSADKLAKVLGLSLTSSDKGKQHGFTGKASRRP